MDKMRFPPLSRADSDILGRILLKLIAELERNSDDDGSESEDEQIIPKTKGEEKVDESVSVEDDSGTEDDSDDDNGIRYIGQTQADSKMMDTIIGMLMVELEGLEKDDERAKKKFKKMPEVGESSKEKK